MDKGASQKRKRIILTSSIFLGVLAIIWFLLLLPARVQLQETIVQTGLAKTDMANAQRAVDNKERVKTDLTNAIARLQTVEAGIANGDILRWVINTFLSFQDEFNVKFDPFERAAGGAPKPLPGLPYEVAVFTVGGVGRYHDFGNFLAAFENRYPHLRIQYLGLEPATEVRSDPQTPGKLNIRMEVAVTIKSSVEAKASIEPKK